MIGEGLPAYEYQSRWFDFFDFPYLTTQATGKALLPRRGDHYNEKLVVNNAPDQARKATRNMTLNCDKLASSVASSVLPLGNESLGWECYVDVEYCNLHVLVHTQHKQDGDGIIAAAARNAGGWTDIIPITDGWEVYVILPLASSWMYEPDDDEPRHP